MAVPACSGDSGLTCLTWDEKRNSWGNALCTFLKTQPLVRNSIAITECVNKLTNS